MNKMNISKKTDNKYYTVKGEFYTLKKKEVKKDFPKELRETRLWEILSAVFFLLACVFLFGVDNKFWGITLLLSCVGVSIFSLYKCIGTGIDLKGKLDDRLERES